MRQLFPYLLLTPAFLLIGTFIFYPLLQSLYLSLTDWKLGTAEARFIGLQNYLTLWRSPEFWNSLKNTVLMVGVGGTVSIVLGFLLAVACQGLPRVRAFWQTVYFLPVTATLSAMAVVWKYIFDPTIGPLTLLFREWNWPTVVWLGDANTALWVVVLVSIWKNTGFVMVLYMAGLTQIPVELKEAAGLDGAHRWQVLRYITLPLLGPTSLFVVIITTLRLMEGSFDVVKVMTDGGPLGASQVLSHLLYQVGFEYFDTGYASSIANVLFLILIVLTLSQARMDRKVHYA